MRIDWTKVHDDIITRATERAAKVRALGVQLDEWGVEIHSVRGGCIWLTATGFARLVEVRPDADVTTSDDIGRTSYLARIDWISVEACADHGGPYLSNEDARPIRLALARRELGAA